MNVLLVDDDYFVIAALEKKIDWRELGVDRVYTAFNIAQAREILLAYPIEVLVCDIEMPQGSGLELLAWIREEQLDVQAIFLTNYADFNYAQKAIGLQSFDYFLKPIEFDKLTLILRKAIAKAGANCAATQNARDRGNPELRRGERRRDHWHRLAASAAARMPESSSADETEELFDRREAFVPLLLELFPREGSLAREEAAREDRALFHYALCNILDELFAGTAFEAEAAGEFRERQWFAVLRLRIGEESTQRADKQPNPAQRSRFGETDALEDRRAVSTEEAAKTCAEFAREADRLLKCGICVNLANAASARDLPAALRELLTMNERLIQQPGRIFRLEEERARPEASYAPPDLEALDRLLHEKRFDSFLEAIHDYLLALKQHGLRDRSALHLLRLDLMQLIYAHLKSKEIQAISFMRAGLSIGCSTIPRGPWTICRPTLNI